MIRTIILISLMIIAILLVIVILPSTVCVCTVQGFFYTHM